MLISLKDNESKMAETVLKGNGFFDEHTSDLTITRNTTETCPNLTIKTTEQHQ